MKSKTYLALVHGPVRNKQNEEITTSVTNLDIHDIARSCKTFGMENYFIVTPIKRQTELIKKILEHWEASQNIAYNPDRAEALKFIHVQPSIEEVVKVITEKEGKPPVIAVTGANFPKYDGGMPELLRLGGVDNRPILLLFGTGWGLTASVCDQADFRLEPIFGLSPDGYNHLSVRSAVAIYCDRLREASGPKV